MNSNHYFLLTLNILKCYIRLYLNPFKFVCSVEFVFHLLNFFPFNVTCLNMHSRKMVAFMGEGGASGSTEQS